MSLTSYEALNKLGTPGYQTVNEIINLLNSVSGKVIDASENNTFLIYSSKLSDGSYTSTLANTTVLFSMPATCAA